MHDFKANNCLSSELPEDILNQMIIIGENFGQFRDREGKLIGNSVRDLILETQHAVWVTDGDYKVVAMALIVDSNDDEWFGFQLRRYIELKIGKDLKRRNERRMFAVLDGYLGSGVEDVVETELRSIDPNLFALCRLNEAHIIKQLKDSGYVFVGKYHSEYTDYDIGVWVMGTTMTASISDLLETEA